jgi:hypothetical protein
VRENIIIKNILDNYNVFSRLEQYLLSPQRLKEQVLFQISDDITEKLIETYYEYLLAKGFKLYAICSDILHI